MKVLKLFKLKDPLNNNEILVGYYRKYKKVIRKESLSVVLHNLGVKGFLMGTDKRGEYCLVDIKSKRFTNEK